MARQRIVITGVGLTAPNGNNLEEYRQNLLQNRSGIQHTEVRHMGDWPAGLCDFDEKKYQGRKMRRRGTRAGSVAIYAANEALADANIHAANLDGQRTGIYLGITEHGNVETEEEIHQLYNSYDLDTSYWSHHHNPRTVANSPAGEVSINLQITGPSYTVGAACAAGNLGLIHACQMLTLGEIDLALAGGVSESAQTFGIFAAFKSQNALASHDDPTLASRPLDKDRRGIVISEGGCLFTLERLEDALERGAKIYGEVIAHHTNSDASDFVLPNPERQIECMNQAMKKAGIGPDEIDLVNMHATGTQQGDIQECRAVRELFANASAAINGTKGHIGHAMGAAGALELAGNLPSFSDGQIHPCRNLENIDPECELENLVTGKAKTRETRTILNNSFGMLGINSSVIVRKYE